jgi:DNA (cytosine-5)-methyltransferase 1
MQGGDVIRIIKEDMEKEGYRVQIWDLYAPDFGVPQNRRRLFFICVRNDLSGAPAPPEPTHIGRHRTISWAIDDLREVTDESVANQSQYFKASKAKRGNGQGDERSRADEPAYTVRANAKSRVQFHYELNRRLTVRECARIQTFPDTFEFPHSATTNIMQIGNAVPPLLAYRVAASIKTFLNGLDR